MPTIPFATTLMTAATLLATAAPQAQFIADIPILAADFREAVLERGRHGHAVEHRVDRNPG